MALSQEKPTYVRGFDSHDKHNPTGCHDGEKSDDVEDANDIQDDVSLSSSFVTAEVEHLEVVLKKWYVGKIVVFES